MRASSCGLYSRLAHAGAVRREHDSPLTADALIGEDILDGRYDVARSLDENPVAYLEVKSLNDVLVVQCHVLHGDIAYDDRLDLSHRRNRSSATHAEGDVLHHRALAQGRELAGESPVGRVAPHSEYLARRQAVELYDHAVAVVVNIVRHLAQRLEGVLDVGLGLKLGDAELHYRKAKLRQPLDNLAVAGEAPGIGLEQQPVGEEVYAALCNLFRIGVAHAASDSVSEAGVKLLSRSLAFVVHQHEAAVWNVRLSHHRDAARYGAVQLERQVRDAYGVLRDILADSAIATSRRRL